MKNQSKFTPHRMEAFSDGVIAIIITLMVFDLRPADESTSLAETLMSLLPGFTIFLMTFLFMAIIWLNHQQLMQQISQVNHAILWWNLTLLFSLSLLPLGAHLLKLHPQDPLAVTVYALLLISIALCFQGMRRQVRQKLLNSSTGFLGTHKKNNWAIGLYILSIPLAFAELWWLSYLFLLATPLLFVFKPRSSSPNSPTP